MRNLKPVQIAFILMGVFILEIIGILQAVFSEQLIKFNLDTQVQYTSEMLLSQFRTSYSANENIQEGIERFCYSNFDTGLVKLYKSLKSVIDTTGSTNEVTFTGKDSLYQVEIHENNKANRDFFSERLGLKVEAIKDYKILSYEMKQDDRLLLGRRILLGNSEDKKWLISIEINQKEIKTQMERTNRTMSSLLNSAYYFSDKTGNFYVIDGAGELLYQGGLEKNASYFGNPELNSGEAIIDLLRQKRSLYKHIIYMKDNQVQRSIIRTVYDEDSDVYFVYEIDQDRIFNKIDSQIRWTWIMGLSALIMTFVVLYVYWETHKRRRRRYL